MVIMIFRGTGFAPSSTHNCTSISAPRNAMWWQSTPPMRLLSER
jgi:hypothetical protein